MDIAELRAFVRIAELGNLSAAARLLKLPKSSVSRALSRLEGKAGAALIERSTRHLRLTDAGILLLPYAIRILDDLDEAAAAMEGLVGAASGLLRVNTTYAVGQGLIAPMLPGFLLNYPDVQVHLDLDYRRIDLLAEGTDVVVRIGPLPDSTLVARALPAVELWLCASPSYLARCGTPTAPRDLENHQIIERQALTTWSFEDPTGTEEIDVHARSIIPDAGAQKVALIGGAGMGRLPDYLASPSIQSGELVRLLPQFQGEMIEMHALYPSHRSLSAKVRVFIDALVLHVKSVRSGIVFPPTG